MPTKPTAADTPVLDALGLNDEERAKLVGELRGELGQAVAYVPPGAEARELTPRERAVRALLRERDHVEDCPVAIGGEELAVGRVEAYNATVPGNPGRGLPPRDVTIARCIECGGFRRLEDRLEVNLLEVLEAAGATDPAPDLDRTL